MPETSNGFLGTEPVGKLILKLSVPTITAQLINMLYNIVDRIYIGHIPNTGAEALTGIGLCFPLIILISAFALLISGGGAPRSSIYMGQKDYGKAEETLNNCFVLHLIASLILTIVLFYGNHSLLMAFGASEKTIGYAESYMNVYALGTIFVQLTLGMNQFITAQGFSKVSMKSVLTGAISNIILDPVFIFYFKMGVKGAALASVISQCLSCIVALKFLLSKKSVIRINKDRMKLNKKIILPCIALGMAPFVMQISESIIAACFNSSLYRYGGDIAVGSMTILSSVMQFAMMPLLGLGQGSQPVISYNYGSKNSERVSQSFKILLKYSFLYSMIIWVLTVAFPGLFASIFTNDPSLIEFTEKSLRIYIMALGIFGIQIACQMTFTSLGYAKQSIIVAVMRKFIILIPLIYIMPHIYTENKTMAVYLAEPIADTLSVIFTVILFSKSYKKCLKSMKE